MVASTTVKGVVLGGVAGVLVLQAAAAAARRMSPATECFMAGDCDAVSRQNENICVYLTTRPRPVGCEMSVNCDSL